MTASGVERSGQRWTFRVDVRDPETGKRRQVRRTYGTAREAKAARAKLIADVDKVLGRAPEVAVPSDRGVPQSVNAARPIICAQPKSSPARSFRAIGDRVTARLLTPKEA